MPSFYIPFQSDPPILVCFRECPRVWSEVLSNSRNLHKVRPVGLKVLPVGVAHCHFSSKSDRSDLSPTGWTLLLHVFQQVLPVGLKSYRLDFSSGAFLASLGFPRLRQLLIHLHIASCWLPELSSVCTLCFKPKRPAHN